MSSKQNMNAAPHVSIVIPTKDRLEFLKQAIDSVRAQDYPKLDLLVVYEHSTDGTLEYLRANGIAHTVVFETSIGAKRNAGLAASTGAILFFLDDDDLLEPTAVSTLVAALREADADLAYGAIVNFVEGADSSSPRGNAVHVTSTHFTHLGSPITAPLNSSTIVLRTAFNRFGPMGDDNHSWARWYLQAVASGLTTVSLDKVVANRRIHGSNISRRGSRYGSFFDLIRDFRPENTTRKGN